MATSAGAYDVGGQVVLPGLVDAHVHLDKAFLPHAGNEHILETYYDLAAASFLNVTLDYQRVENPAYNRDRGPASIFALRVHAAR